MWLTFTLLSSIAFGIGATLQKHGMASEFPKLSFGQLWRDLGRITWTLLTNWVWLLGVAATVSACVLMTLAIDVGEISVVLPLLNISLVVSLALGVAVLGERLRSGEWVGAITLIIGSALVSASGFDVATEPGGLPAVSPSTGDLAWTFGGCAAVLGLLVVVGRALRNRLPPELTLPVVAGMLFGTGGVLIKLTTLQLGPAGATAGAVELLALVMSEPATWAAIALSLVAFVFFQVAFSHGRVSVVVQMVSIAALVPPLVAGLVAFDEAVGVLRLVGILVVALGLALLLAKPASGQRATPRG